MKKLFKNVLIPGSLGLAMIFSTTQPASLILGQNAFFTSVEAKSRKVSLNKKHLTLTAGQSYVLKLENAKKVKWKSANKKVATVTKGKVKAIKAGTTIITATYKKKKYTCKIKVINKKVKLNKSRLNLTVGQTYTLKLSNAKSVKWQTSDKAIASVTKGKVKALKAGIAKITATYKKKKYVCRVTVVQKEKS